MTLLQHELTDFKVNAFQNNEFHEVTKDDVLGHWSLFFFYPADFTFVCPTELEDLAKNYAKFKEIGCEIYSVSCDTHFVHKAWHDANEKIAKIEYPMLADPTALLAKDLDTYNEADGVAERGDFIAARQAFAHLHVFLLALLLRTDQEEPEHGKDDDERNDLHEEAFHAAHLSGGLAGSHGIANKKHLNSSDSGMCEIGTFGGSESRRRRFETL